MLLPLPRHGLPVIPGDGVGELLAELVELQLSIVQLAIDDTQSLDDHSDMRARSLNLPAASPKALKRISRTVRRWTLHHRSDLSLTELAAMHNPCIRGWIGYYGHFYKEQLRPTLKRIDAYVFRWARRKFKRMRHRPKVARDWFDRLRRANPHLFAHWVLCHGNGRTSGAV